MDKPVKIDEIDAKMIKMLLNEARTSFTAIGKECKITVGAVRMRYKRLIKEGVINGEVMLVNPHCLGYRHIIDLGIITDSENEDEVAKYLDSKPYLSETIKHFDKFNFYTKTALKDLNQLSKIIEDLESNHKIKHVDSLIWSEAVNVEFPQNLIIKPLKQETGNKKTQRPALTKLDQAPLEIDETDRKIAQILSRKARTPFRKIAQQLGLSTKTVIQRYRKLRENLLTLSTITLDLNKLGYKATGSIFIKASNRSRMTEIYSQLLEIPNVVVIIRVIGAYDLYVALVLEDFESLFEAKEKIRQISGLEKIDVFLTPTLPAWPLNLFTALLDNEDMPKHWPEETSSQTQKTN